MITTIENYISCPKTTLGFFKSGTIATTSSQLYNIMPAAGVPTAPLAMAETAAGILQIGSMTGYITGIPQTPTNELFITANNFSSYVLTVGSTVRFYDFLYKVGTYAFNESSTLTGQPSIAARVPNTDYTQIEMFFEAVTAFTGNPLVVVTYTNQDGVTGRTSSYGIGTPVPANQMRKFPLQGNDTGVMMIESVTASLATVGTFNIVLARFLFQTSVDKSMKQNVGTILDVAPVKIYPSSAIGCVMISPTTTTSAISVLMEVSDG